MATTGKLSATQPTEDGGHTLGLNPVPNRGKGTADISSRAIIGGRPCRSRVRSSPLVGEISLQGDPGGLVVRLG